MSKGKKFKHRNRQPQPPAHIQRPAVEVLPSLDLGFLNAAVITPPEWKMAHIIVAGAGGIGSYLVQHIGRIMRVLYQSDKGCHLTICDPDVVEDQNIGRQLFCDAERGVPKAEALARRYGHAWGLNVTHFVGKYDESFLLGTDVTLLVGCVDNAAARQSLAQTLEHNPQDPEGQPSIFWLDCGNLRDTGRVLLGTDNEAAQLRGAFPDAKHCLRLPSPALQSPGLLEPQPEELEGGCMSCAEMAAANLQSLNINARIAAEAADMITRLLVTNDLKRFSCEVNLAAGSVRSYYSTPAEVARVIKQPMSYVRAQASAAVA